ncbi:DegT/DnrJ/EryC1/StrS aminotransferase family protein [Synechococcus sp. BL107]|uniref:DegT/DnrJ/EryC1/StrS family aminotransferase n=1 Tax=Synechococcus sp. BL107 TaxID=313625 RepID=UPI0002F08AF8|nr:DegT/DnrJ/EryC1/StrS aminotransferase family protein [Synechococcus sp. BL107]
MNHSIKMCGPSITQHEKNIILKMMDDGWDSYQYVEEFEERFAKWHDRRFCLMTPCCTHAIHLGLIALGINIGDEVIVPETTWTGSVAPITYTGARPVFCDVEKDNWCLSSDTINTQITSKTKAVIAVDIYGFMPDYMKLEKLCAENNIVIIEDAAEALGSSLRGIRAGKFGLFSVHSFHRTKTITTGEGGALLTDDENFYKRCKFLRDHGRSAEQPYLILEATTKYMPSNLMGAMACAQLDRINELISIKQAIRDRYLSNFEGQDFDFTLTSDNTNFVNGCWATTLVIENEAFNSSSTIKNLAFKGIPLRPFFRPLSSMPAYTNYKNKSNNSNSDWLFKKGITLPSHYELDNNTIDYISDHLLKEIVS